MPGNLPELPEPAPTPTQTMPPNSVEVPDLPAGVPKPPAQSPFMPEEKHPVEHPGKHPQELQDLYGPDHNLDDDSVVDKPVKKQDVEKPEVLPKTLEPEVKPEEQESEEHKPEPEEIDQSQQPVPDPPVHEFCHCKIITMPGGRRIWRTNNNACAQCAGARDAFNQWQASLFGS